MSENSSPVDCDPSEKSTKPIKFVYKESQSRTLTVKVCPSCGSKCIRKSKSRSGKVGFGELIDTHKKMEV